MPYRLPPAPRATRPSQIIPNPPRPIAVTSPLLTCIWSLHQHYREHNTELTKLHGAKSAAFANALSVPSTERRPQPGDFKYSLYGPFGKHYGRIVKLHAWKGAEVYWGECMLKIWGLVKYQAWAAQRDEERKDKERRLREEEESVWEAVDMLGEMKKNIQVEAGASDGRDSVRGGAVESLGCEGESTNAAQEMDFSSDGVPADTDTNATGPSDSGEVTVEEDADSCSLGEGPEALPSWAQPFVDLLPQAPPPSKTSSNIPFSIYSPFHQHHTMLVLDPIPVESAYPACHTLVLYHYVLTTHPILSQEAQDSRILPFLRGPPDLISTPLRNLRFNSFDFLFRATLRRHIGKARRGLAAITEQGNESNAIKEKVNEEEPEKWGRWNQWEEMVLEGEISPPGLGRFRGYMGQKLWRLKNPGKKRYSAPITQQRWGKDRKSERAGVLGGKENWLEEVLMGTADPKPQVEAEPMGLAPELEKALNVLFEKPRGKAHDAALVATVEDGSEAVGLPKVDEPVEVKRPIHEEFNEVAKAGRRHLSLKQELNFSAITNIESHVEKMDANSVEETIKTSTVQSIENEGIPTSMAEHKQEECEIIEVEHKHRDHEHRAMNSNTTQGNRARKSGAEWLDNVFHDVPTTESNTFVFQRRRTGRDTLTSSRPPFLATDVFPPQISPPQPPSDPASSANLLFPSQQSQSPSYSEPAEDSFEDWAIKTGFFSSPEDRAWMYVDPRTKPPAPRSDKETKWTVHLAEQLRSSGYQEDEEDLTALQRELELVRRKIARIKSNEWWKRYEGKQVGSVDFEVEPRTAPDGLWGKGRGDWRRLSRKNMGARKR